MIGRAQFFFVMWGVGALGAGLTAKFGLNVALVVVTVWALILAAAYDFVGKVINGR